MRQHTNTTKSHEYQDLYSSSVAVLLREMQREVMTAANGHQSARQHPRRDIEMCTLYISYAVSHPASSHMLAPSDPSHTLCIMLSGSDRTPSAGP